MHNKTSISVREFCTDISNFFEATPIHISTASQVENVLNTHKKSNGKNIVLLVSNGLSTNTEEKEHLSISNARILNKLSLVDKEVINLKKDRSLDLYSDILNYIMREDNVELSPYSQAHLFSHKNYGSDKELLSDVCKTITTNTSKPQFIVAFLASSFLTNNGALTQLENDIGMMVENTNSTGSLYFLTSTHTQQKEETNTYKTHVRPIVPLLVIAELLRNKKEHANEQPIEWKRLDSKQIDFSCLFRPSFYRGR